MVSCALWEFEEALGWVILNNALAPLVHYSESPTLVPLQIFHNAQLTILYCPNIRPREGPGSILNLMFFFFFQYYVGGRVGHNAQVGQNAHRSCDVDYDVYLYSARVCHMFDHRGF